MRPAIGRNWSIQIAGLVPLLAAMAAIAVALATFGWRILNPQDTGWLQGDAITTQFGWHQYQHDPANFYPIATDRASFPLPMPNAIFGTLPILDLILKPFAALLPYNFQYLGPVFVAGIGLQALLGWAVLREVTQRGAGACYNLALFFGALLFATAPVMIVRFYYTHLPLALQWPLLFSLWAYLRSFRVGYWQSIGIFSLIVFVSAGINPYTMMMAVLIYGGFIVKSLVERSLEWPKFVLMVIPLMCGIAGLDVFGFIEPNSLGAFGGTGFGYFSSNFLALIDPVYEYFSAEFIGDPQVMRPGQYEGFGYLGVGVMFLLVASVIVALWTRGKAAPQGRRIYLPLFVVVLVSYLWAMSNVMAFGSWVVVVPLPAFVMDILQNFRSAGRFIAVVIYVLMFIGIATLLQRLKPQHAAMVLALAVLLQAADLARPYAQLRQRFDDRYLTRGIVERFADPAYRNLGAAHAALVVLPPWQCFEGGPLKPDYPRPMFIKFTNLAMDNNLRSNSFYGGRTPVIQAFYHCDVYFRGLRSRPADRRTAYLLSQPIFAQYGAHIAATHRCDFADGLFICRGDGGAPGLTERAKTASAAVIRTAQAAAGT